MYYSLARDTPLVNVSCKSVQYFVSIPDDGRTDEYTNQHDQNKCYTTDMFEPQYRF